MPRLIKPEIINIFEAKMVLTDQLEKERLSEVYLDIDEVNSTVQEQNDHHKWHAIGKVKWEYDRVIFSMYGEKSDRVITLEDVKKYKDSWKD